MQFRAKQRLLLVGAAVLAVILAFTFVSSRNSSGQHPLQALPTPTIAVATATAEDVSTIKSWGLTPADMPAGTVLFNATEIPLSAAANNDPAQEKQLEAYGFVTAYQQQWRQTTAQYEFADETDLYRSAPEAITRLRANPEVATGNELKDLPDPKIGDASRMYTVTTNPAGGAQQTAFVVAWVRDRALHLVTSASPPGALGSDVVLGLARTVDKRAAAAPLK